jgi:hypothetical protein
VTIPLAKDSGQSTKIRKFSFEIGVGVPEILSSGIKYQINSSWAFGIKYVRLVRKYSYGVSFSYYFRQTDKKNFLNVLVLETMFSKNKRFIIIPYFIPSNNKSIDIYIGHDQILYKKIGFNFFVGFKNLFKDMKLVWILMPSFRFSVKFNY